MNILGNNEFRSQKFQLLLDDILVPSNSYQEYTSMEGNDFDNKLKETELKDITMN